MPRSVKLAIAALLLTACLLPGAAAAASSQRSCPSADLRFPADLFAHNGPRIFGVFGLRIAHGPCTTAHRVAETWMSRFETAFRAGRTVVPRSVGGFRFKTLPAREAQEFRERGQMGATTIWFDYRIPNG